MMRLYLIAGLALALLASLVANVEQLRRAAAAKAAAAGTVDRVIDANESCAAVTSRLQLDRASCEAQLDLDRARAAEAFAAHARARDDIARRLAAARAEQARSQAQECREWAAQPTCGVSP